MPLSGHFPRRVDLRLSQDESALEISKEFEYVSLRDLLEAQPAGRPNFIRRDRQHVVHDGGRSYFCATNASHLFPNCFVYLTQIWSFQTNSTQTSIQNYLKWIA